ncbi:hypothetical protein DPEC_G00100740 [Dallia pectoralis]|uniref:Uncharacterized protein n=1 Tax=Dallia pectoralis TaxID=75939 RepID=A0ACC2GWI5_DALPE|nr:hypothetical protein DPEC_G00100740 [Dallia pectoralis]
MCAVLVAHTDAGLAGFTIRASNKTRSSLVRSAASLDKQERAGGFGLGRVWPRPIPRSITLTSTVLTCAAVTMGGCYVVRIAFIPVQRPISIEPPCFPACLYSAKPPPHACLFSGKLLSIACALSVLMNPWLEKVYSGDNDKNNSGSRTARANSNAWQTTLLD